MAEPEDVEEDLFADLYDADDATNRNTSAVEAPKFAESTASATPAQPSTFPIVQTVESYHDETENTHFRDYNQTSQYEGRQQNGAGNVDTSYNGGAASAAMEHEPQGTGIKEDG